MSLVSGLRPTDRPTDRPMFVCLDFIILDIRTASNVSSTAVCLEIGKLVMTWTVNTTGICRTIHLSWQNRGRALLPWLWESIFSPIIVLPLRPHPTSLEKNVLWSEQRRKFYKNPVWVHKCKIENVQSPHRLKMFTCSEYVARCISRQKRVGACWSCGTRTIVSGRDSRTPSADWRRFPFIYQVISYWDDLTKPVEMSVRPNVRTSARPSVHIETQGSHMLNSGMGRCR